MSKNGPWWRSKSLWLTAALGASAVLASACDDEPKWTWAEWAQYDAGVTVKTDAGLDGGSLDGSVSDAGSADASAGDGAAADAGDADAQVDASK
jgi:hypothetical protein